MTETMENVHIYLNNQKKRDDILGTATPQEKYIILMNDSLNYKNKELEGDIHDLEAQLEVFDGYVAGILEN